MASHGIVYSRTWLTSTLHSTKETSYVSDIVKDVNVLTEGREFEDWLAWISGNSWNCFRLYRTTATAFSRYLGR